MNRTILMTATLFTAAFAQTLSSAEPKQEYAEAIVKETFVDNPKMDELFYMIATKKISESNKKIAIDPFVDKLKQELNSKKNLEKFAESYTDRFSKEELTELKKIVQSPVFQKYSEEAFFIMKESLQQVDSIVDNMIEQAQVPEASSQTSEVIEITSENFEAEVQNSQLPVTLDFYADWCGPCKGMKVILEDLSTEMQGKVKFAKLNIEHEKEIADKFNVKDLPVVIFIKDGKIKGVHSGFADKSTLSSKIQEHLL